MKLLSMVKKCPMLALMLIINSQANGMAAMRHFGIWAKSWSKPALFSGIAAWYNRYSAKSILCETKHSAITSTLQPTNPTDLTPISKLSFKEFDKKRDTTFLLDCLQKDAYWFLSSNVKTRYDLYSLLEDKNVIILYDHGTPVGFGIYSANKINYLGVSQENRGKGYGAKLIQHMINILKTEYKKITLLVRSDNLTAIDLYKKFGFKYKSAYGPNINILRLNTQPKSQNECLKKYWGQKYFEILE